MPGGSLSAPRGLVGTQICVTIKIVVFFRIRDDKIKRILKFFNKNMKMVAKEQSDIES